MAATHAADARPLIERIERGADRCAMMRGRAAAVSALRERAKSDAAAGAARRGLGSIPAPRRCWPASSAARRILTGLIDRDPARLQRILTTAPEARLRELKAELAATLALPRRAPTSCARCASSRARWRC